MTDIAVVKEKCY